jgi:hypothetical protein
LETEILALDQVPVLPTGLTPNKNPYNPEWKVYDYVDTKGHAMRWRYRYDQLTTFIRYRKIAGGEYRPEAIWEDYKPEHLH